MHKSPTLRIVTRFEHRYAAFDGLNLTWETLEGIAKHNGSLPLLLLRTRITSPLIVDNALLCDFGTGTWLKLEIWPNLLKDQIVVLADDIAYDNHDLDGGPTGQTVHDQ